MTTHRKKKAGPDERQMVFNLFLTVPDSAGEAAGGEPSDFDLGLRRVLKQMLEGRDRSEIAAALAEKLGRDIGKVQLDQWIAPSQAERRCHVDGLWALTLITGDMRGLQFLVEQCGMALLTTREAAFAQFGAMAALEDKMKREKRRAMDGVTDADVSALLAKLGGGA